MDISLLLNEPGRSWQTVAGAGEGKIQRLVSLAPVRLPPELLALLRSSDGGEGELALPPGWFVLDPVDEIIRGLSDPWEREQFPGFVFFGGNGGLERIALDCREDTEPWPVVTIDPIAGPESSERIASSFYTFIQAIGLPQPENRLPGLTAAPLQVVPPVLPATRSPPRMTMIFASRSDRLLGQALDAIVALMPIIGIAFITTLAPEPIASVAEMLWLPALVLCLAYLFFADALPGGQSFGKQMLGIAVVDQRSGLPCSAWQSFVRNLLLAILGFFDWIFIFGEQYQRLGDKAAGTIVVDAATVPVGAGAYDQ